MPSINYEKIKRLSLYFFTTYIFKQLKIFEIYTYLLPKPFLLGQALPNRNLQAGLFLKFYNWLIVPLKLSEPNPTMYLR